MKMAELWDLFPNLLRTSHVSHYAPSGSGAKIIMSSSWSSCALREPAIWLPRVEKVMHGTGTQGFFFCSVYRVYQPYTQVFAGDKKKSSKIPREKVGEKCLASMVVNHQATPPEKKKKLMASGKRKDIYGPVVLNDRHLFLAPKF